MPHQIKNRGEQRRGAHSNPQRYAVSVRFTRIVNAEKNFDANYKKHNTCEAVNLLQSTQQSVTWHVSMKILENEAVSRRRSITGQFWIITQKTQLANQTVRSQQFGYAIHSFAVENVFPRTEIQPRALRARVFKVSALYHEPILCGDGFGIACKLFFVFLFFFVFFVVQIRLILQILGQRRSFRRAIQTGFGAN